MYITGSLRNANIEFFTASRILTILYFGRMPIESVIRPLNGQISRGIRPAPSKFVPEEEGFEHAVRLG
jgi:hypothetical protein